MISTFTELSFNAILNHIRSRGKQPIERTLLQSYGPVSRYLDRLKKREREKKKKVIKWQCTKFCNCTYNKTAKGNLHGK